MMKHVERVFHTSSQTYGSNFLFTIVGFITVNDRLNAAALKKVLRFLSAALVQLRRLIDCGAYFKDC